MTVCMQTESKSVAKVHADKENGRITLSTKEFEDDFHVSCLQDSKIQCSVEKVSSQTLTLEGTVHLTGRVDVELSRAMLRKR